MKPTSASSEKKRELIVTSSVFQKIGICIQRGKHNFIICLIIFTRMSDYRRILDSGSDLLHTWIRNSLLHLKIHYYIHTSVHSHVFTVVAC
jgi:hypothetical protein